MRRRRAGSCGQVQEKKQGTPKRMTLFSLLEAPARRRARKAAARALYAAVVAQARRPLFYSGWQVPDSVDGRFDMLALHLFLLLDRLRAAGPEARRLSQTLVDIFVQDMDVNLREMGVGDLSVGKRVRKHAAALYGRLDAYRTAMADTDAEVLVRAVSRNVYRADNGKTAGSAARLAAYMREQAAFLAGQKNETLIQGEAQFNPPG